MQCDFWKEVIHQTSMPSLPTRVCIMVSSFHQNFLVILPLHGSDANLCEPSRPTEAVGGRDTSHRHTSRQGGPVYTFLPPQQMYKTPFLGHGLRPGLASDVHL